MQEIQLSQFKKDFNNIIEIISHTHKPVMITNKGRLFLKIVPFISSKKDSWLGCMKVSGKIIGDIVSPVEKANIWEVLSK